jgi:hypothetical protein
MTDSGVSELFEYLRENSNNIYSDNVLSYFLNENKNNSEFQYEYENFDEFCMFEFDNEANYNDSEDEFEPDVIIGKKIHHVLPQQYKYHDNHLSNELETP